MSKLVFLKFILLLAVFSISAFLQAETSYLRGGISFSITEPYFVTEQDQAYLVFNVAASAASREDELGTGMVLLGYNTLSFGEFVHANGNVTITKGELLITNPVALYDLFLNDRNSDCLAITFEYTSSDGQGNNLTISQKPLFQVKLRIQSYGYPAGLSLLSPFMLRQQYEDDNTTLLDPVIITNNDFGFLAPKPLNLQILNNNGTLSLTWDALPGYKYNVYSSETPGSVNWQLAASGLLQPNWIINQPDEHRFYRVTSHWNSERRQP